MTALGRVGLPDDIEPMIAALLSDDNRRVKGQRIEVFGGMSFLHPDRPTGPCPISRPNVTREYVSSELTLPRYHPN